MKMRIAALMLLASALSAHAQTPGFYVLKDTAGNTFNVGTYTFGGKIFPISVSSDSSGNPLGGVVGTTNPNGTALYVQGVTGGVSLPTSITGSLPSFASPQHFVCDSGCTSGGGGGLTVTYGSPIGTLGTPSGFRDVSGNFQSLLGDLTNGQWVSIKASIAIPVTGTFFQATQPVSAASLPLPSNAAAETGGNLAAISTNTGRIPAQGQALAGASMPVVLTAAQITTLTPPTSVGITGTLPAFAATPTVNLGTIGGAATQTTLASVLTALGTPFQAGGSIVNISGTVSLPTGASTAANQTSPLGSVGGGTVASNSMLGGGQYNSTPLTLTNLQQSALQIDANGYLKVNVTAGGGSSGGVAGPVTQTAVSVTNASTQVAAAAAFTNFGKLCVPATAANGVWVRWDGGTAGVVPPAEYITPSQCANWIKVSGYLPNQQWNAISNSASTIVVSLIGN